jgi:hypothetical protein
MIKFLLLNLTLVLFSSLNAYEQEMFYRDNAASYIAQITKSIVKQFNHSPYIATLKKESLAALPMTDINQVKSTLPITKRIDESLLYELSYQNFKVIDLESVKRLGIKKSLNHYVLVSNFIKYKHEIVIYSKIIDKDTALVYAVAQVQVPRKILKDIDKLYNENSWFSPHQKDVPSHHVLHSSNPY